MFEGGGMSDTSTNIMESEHNFYNILYFQLHKWPKNWTVVVVRKRRADFDSSETRDYCVKEMVTKTKGINMWSLIRKTEEVRTFLA